MNEQEVKDKIESFIVTNGVNAITADVLRPILIAMLIQPNEAIGDLDTLNTVTQDNLVDAINEIYNAVNNTVNDGIQLYQGDSDPNVEPPDSYDIADFYFEEGTQLWQYNGFEWIKVNYGDSINLPFKGRFDYIDSPIFSLPTGVKALDVRFNGTGSDINWNQLGNNVKYNGTIGIGDYLIVIGLYSNVPIGTIPSLEMVTSQGSRTLVTIQSPDAVNSDDLVNLGQVEEMISEIPTPILFTTDASLYLDPITNELRANTGLSTEKFEYASGVQEFTLVDEPSFVISLMLNLVAINNPLTDYSIDGKKLTILKPIEPTDKINITYQFIITT